MPTLSVQIHNHPPFITLLDVGYGRLCDLGPAKTATRKDSHNGAVPLSFQNVQIRRP
jgi:hypothetical protein